CRLLSVWYSFFFFFQAEDGIRAFHVTGVQTCALPILKAQMKYADRRNAPCVVIQGSQEREAGEIQIKDLIEGKRLSAEIEDNVTWRESRPAQITVKEDALVEAVREILEAQARDRAQRQSNTQ